MKVNEIAKKAEVTPEVVRYYLRIGLLKSDDKDANGYRRFSEHSLRRLNFIRRAKQLGFKLSELAEILRMAARRKTPCPMVRDIVKRRIEDNRVDLESLRALQRRMERALAQWHRMRNGVPDGHTVCRLIESAEIHA